MNKLMKELFRISLFKTVYWNLKLFPLKIAIKMPLCIYRRTIFKIKGKVIIDSEEGIVPGMIRIGKGDSDRKTLIIVEGDDGKLVFHGKNTISSGCKIKVFDSGELSFGVGTSVNFETNIDTCKSIEIGSWSIVSAFCYISDTDWHSVIIDGLVSNPDTNINIGNHVWIGLRCIILKGTDVPDGSVIGAGSLVNREFSEKKQIIAGVPGKSIKTISSWDLQHPVCEHRN